jgi:hypothetical protein
MLINDILEALKYDRKPFEKRLSASQIGMGKYELLMNFLHGSINNDFGQQTIGSLIHKGMEDLLPKERYKSELDFSVTISEFHNFEITGTLDLYDIEDRVIYDIKTTKYNTYKKLKEAIEKGDYTHDYILQLNVYKFLSKEKLDVDTLSLFFIFKDGGWDYKSKTKKPDYKILNVPILSESEVVEIITDKLHSIEPYLIFDANDNIIDVKLPQACDSKTKYGFITTKDSNKKPSKCELYCSYKNVCNAYYNDNKQLDW